ncbi:hypothetical protein BDZ89DRAFT_1130287 [Hymenopellis radicata]|nr:hypothetical protein BDZ89DRAFT_1130287 [Hymenopellis radicata]
MSFVNLAHFWADLLETGRNLTKFANRTQHYHLGEKSKQLWQVAPAYKGSMYTRDRNVEHMPHVVRAAPTRKCPFHPAESDSPPDIYANCRLCHSAHLRGRNQLLVTWIVHDWAILEVFVDCYMIQRPGIAPNLVYPQPW